jgi:hypothetical protein
VLWLDYYFEGYACSLDSSPKYMADKESFCLEAGAFVGLIKLPGGVGFVFPKVGNPSDFLVVYLRLSSR